MCKRRLRSCGALGTAILHALWKNMPALTTFGDDGLFGLPEYPDVEARSSTDLRFQQCSSLVRPRAWTG
jgi:hypothetical protein